MTSKNGTLFEQNLMQPKSPAILYNKNNNKRKKKRYYTHNECDTCNGSQLLPSRFSSLRTDKKTPPPLPFPCVFALLFPFLLILWQFQFRKFQFLGHDRKHIVVNVAQSSAPSIMLLDYVDTAFFRAI